MGTLATYLTVLLSKTYDDKQGAGLRWLGLHKRECFRRLSNEVQTAWSFPSSKEITFSMHRAHAAHKNSIIFLYKSETKDQDRKKKGQERLFCPCLALCVCLSRCCMYSKVHIPRQTFRAFKY